MNLAQEVENLRSFDDVTIERQFGHQLQSLDDQGNTVLHHVAFCDKAGAVKKLVKLGANINQVNSGGSTPLHIACRMGYVSTARALVEHGADVHQTNAFGNLPIEVAAKNDKPGCVNLLRNIDDPNLPLNKRAKSIQLKVAAQLQDAIIHGEPAKLKEVIGAYDVNDPFDDEYLLHTAVKNAKEDAIRVLINMGASCVVADGETKETAMHIAAKLGLTKIMKLLKINGADPNAQDAEGLTPLHVAKDLDTVKQLCLWDVKSLLDKNGQSVLHHCVKRDATEIFRYVMEHISDVDLKIHDKEGQTAVEIAMSLGRMHFIHLIKEVQERVVTRTRQLITASRKGLLFEMEDLINAGAEVNGLGEGYPTPLHYACGNGHYSAADLLLSRKADHMRRDGNGATPLHWAAYGGALDIIRLLIVEHQTAANARTKTGSTPCHYAFMNGKSDAAVLLEQLGADVHVPDSDGRYAQDLAGSPKKVRLSL